MAKTLNIKYNGTEYTLEFNRKSIETLEKRGFRVADIQNKPVCTLPAFFAGAFLAHHKFVKQEVIDEIFSNLKNKDDLLEKLAEMYSEPLLTLMDEPDENSEGNAEWTPSW